MKRTVALLVALLLVCLCGCGDKAKKSELEVDIEYYAGIGQMPESEYALSADIAQFEKLAQESAESTEHNHDAVYYEIEDMGENSCIYAGQFLYYYENDEKEDGVACIVSYDGGYGFEAATVSVEIRDTLADAGYTAEERDAEQDDTFFLPKGNFTCLEYDFDERTVKFIFEDNLLTACLLADEDWSF